MIFDNTLTISDILNAILLLTAIIGGYISWIEYKKI